MKFTLDQADHFDSHNIRGYSYNSSVDFGEMSAAIMEVSGWHGMVKAPQSRCFYILEGAGLFVIGGTQHNVEKGEIVMVPAQQPHDFTGEMKILVVHSPAFVKEYVKSLE